MSIYLGIESSCDETAVAVVADGRRVLSSRLISQTDLHKQFGGVVPEVAARSHVDAVNKLIAEALEESAIRPSDLAGVAATCGPGLVGTLLVGLCSAKALAWSWGVPLVVVDHLMAHVCANYIDTDLEPPFVALLVSGGHTQIIHFEDYKQGRILGQTLDDAAGEAYDKVARLIGLGYPGGPVIDSLAKTGNPKAFKFPEGQVAGFDFSFSGLKTAVLRCVEKLEKPLPEADLAASFQDAVVRVLVKKTLAAQKQLDAKCVVLAGGVAANSELRARMKSESTVPVYYPQMSFCTDNAAMVAAAAHFCGSAADFSVGVYSRQRSATS